MDDESAKVERWFDRYWFVIVFTFVLLFSLFLGLMAYQTWGR